MSSTPAFRPSSEPTKCGVEPAAGEPKLAWAGLALAQAMKSATLRTLAEVRQLYESVGVHPGADVVVYCGGGVLSALAVLTLEALGHRPRLFVGSWSQWNKCPQRMALSATSLSASSQEVAA